MAPGEAPEGFLEIPGGSLGCFCISLSLSASIYLPNENDDDDDVDGDGDGDGDGNVADDDGDDDDSTPRVDPYLFFARKWLQRHSRSPISF